MASASKLKKSVRDRRYYQRHRDRILQRKRDSYAAEPARQIAIVARYRSSLKAFNVSPVAT